MKNWIVPFLVVSAFWGGCKKADETPPVIVIHSPEFNDGFSIPGVIPVTATIEDDENLEWVSVQLFRVGLIAAHKRVTLEPEGKTFEWTKNYSLSDAGFETGNYWLQVKASDGENEASEFVEVRVTSGPINRSGFVLVSSDGTSTDVSLADKNFAISSIGQLAHDYSGSGVNSTFQQLVIAGYEEPILLGKSVEDFGTEWSVESTSTPGFPVFESLNYQNGVAWVGHRDGFVKGYDQNGSVQLVCDLDDYHYPTYAYQHGNYLLVHEEHVAQSDHQLTSYFAANGDRAQGITYDQKTVGMASLNTEEVFVLGNENGQGKLLIFDTGQNGFWEPETLPTGMVYDLISYAPGELLIAHDNGVYKYEHSLTSLTLLVPTPGVTDLELDELSNEVITAAGTAVRGYAIASGSLNFSFTHSLPVDRVHVLYNR